MSDLHSILLEYLAEATIADWVRVDEPAVERQGILVALSRDHAVFLQVADAIFLDGYAALRLDSMASIRPAQASEELHRVLAFRRQPVVAPRVSPTPDFRSLLRALAGQNVILHENDPEVCWIGRLSISGSEAVVELLDLKGENAGSHGVALQDVSMGADRALRHGRPAESSDRLIDCPERTRVLR